MPEPRDATAPCPDLAELLMASEGELSKRRQSEVSAHLRLCPACREQLGSVGLALREYQDAVTNANATTRAAEADASADRLEVFRDRLQDERRTQTANRVRLPFRRWLPVAAAVPVLVGALFFSNRYTSVLRAEELLTKAAAQEQTVPANTVRRLEIHIKRTGVRTTRDVGTSARIVSASENNADVEVTRRLAASHLDPQDPLSVRAFRTWHDSLRSKTDSVSPAGRDALALHTETEDGVLQSVDLIVRRIDFQPLRATFAFADLGEVEITELSRWVAPALTVAERSAPTIPNVAPEPTAKSTNALDETELDVRAALHRVGLDANSAIAVTRSAHAVEVRGHVVGQRKSEVTRALMNIGSVKMLLHTDTDPAPAASSLNLLEPPKNVAPPEPLAAVDTTARVPEGMEATSTTSGSPGAYTRPVPASLQHWLERTFGHGGAASAFLPDLESVTEQVQHRSAAFALLAKRYPVSEAHRLAPDAGRKLDALADTQYRDLVSAIEALNDRLSLFLGTRTRRAALAPPQPWQQCALELPARTDTLVDALRTVMRQTDLPLPTDLQAGRHEPSSLSNLREAADALWNQVSSPAQPD